MTALLVGIGLLVVAFAPFALDRRRDFDLSWTIVPATAGGFLTVWAGLGLLWPR